MDPKTWDSEIFVSVSHVFFQYVCMWNDRRKKMTDLNYIMDWNQDLDQYLYGMYVHTKGLSDDENGRDKDHTDGREDIQMQHSSGYSLS